MARIEMDCNLKKLGQLSQVLALFFGKIGKNVVNQWIRLFLTEFT